eukprot:4500177-Amphidinium_carterae.1
MRPNKELQCGDLHHHEIWKCFEGVSWPLIFGHLFQMRIVLDRAWKDPPKRGCANMYVRHMCTLA